MHSNKAVVVFALTLTCFVAFSAMAQIEGDGCTVIGVGIDATVDGSVITSHTDASSECRLHVVPGKTFPKGAKAPVYWGMVYFGPGDERAGQPLGHYGRVLGEIPQVEETYTYFHTGYSQMNAHQLAIGESTCSQRAELFVDVDQGKQIMTVEQAQAFALERAKTARGAIEVITSLIDEYGFLPSCGGAETLVIADTKEVWSLEIFSVGPDWDPTSGEPGALWAARRVPDGHITVVPNYVRIREIDLDDPDQMASSNYMKVAIDKGWYDPKSGKPFIWQEAYAPPVTEGSLNRLWLIYSTVAPSFKKWPDRSLKGKTSGPDTMSSQSMEGAGFYPYSVKPEKKLSVRDIIAFQRSVYDGTIYSMAADPAWLVPDGKGGYDTSPLTTPFPSPELRKLLRIPFHRPIPRHGYGMVAQLRDWLPDPGRRCLLVLCGQSLRQHLRPGVRGYSGNLAFLSSLRRRAVQRGLCSLGRRLGRQPTSSEMAGGDPGPSDGP